MFDLIDFFKDPIISYSTIGVMLMGLSSALVGVMVYVQKRALLGETISHAGYPGIVLSILFFSFLFEKNADYFPLFALLGSFFTGVLGLYLVGYLEKKQKMNADTALCFVLSTFLGFGVLLASKLQFSQPIWYQRVESILYGQAATMLYKHVCIYAGFAFFLILFLMLFFQHLKLYFFDRAFLNMNFRQKRFLELAIILWIVSAIGLGVRSVGVVLMAGMLIAPAASASFFVKKLKNLFLLSALFGLVIGFLGVYLSVNGSIYLSNRFEAKVPLPLGPIILIVATLFTIMSLVFSPRKGLITRMIRKKNFKMNCAEENILKYLFKAKNEVSFKDLQEVSRFSFPVLVFVLLMMEFKKLIVTKNGYKLTHPGKVKAQRIVRLHRLWEVYLFEKLGIDAENVHKSAEEMEHIITSELEEELVKLLGNPKKDPHDQAIPESS